MEKLINYIESRIKLHKKNLQCVSGGNARGKYNALINELELVKDIIAELKTIMKKQ